MPEVEFIRAFPIAEDGMHVVTWPVGVHSVSEECAKIARENGFAKAARPSGGQTGPEKQSSLPQPDQAKTGPKSKKPRAKPKS